MVVHSDRFLSMVAELEPPWGGFSWSLKRYLEIFDESAALRPLFRVHLPENFAHWSARKQGIETPHIVSEAEAELYAHLQHLLLSVEMSSQDPESPSILEQPPSELAERVEIPSNGDAVLWANWKIEVAEYDGRQLTEPCVVSFYGEWQRLRMWALLEKYSLRLLADPRVFHPQQVFDIDWDKDVRGKILSWSAGSPRLLRIVELLEEDDWLERLYRSRRISRLGQARIWDPRLHGWPEGEELSSERRATIQTERVKESCRTIGGAWLDNQRGFVEKIRLLIELWGHAVEEGTNRLTQVIESDLRAATHWASYLYGFEFKALNETVGACGPWNKTTLEHVLRPEWRRARTAAERALPHFAEGFNQLIHMIHLESNDVEVFLAFLDKHELWSWYVELSQFLGELNEPSDLSWDRRFLHMRSLIILNEAILVALADEFGTEDDRKRFQTGKVQDSLKVFLSHREGWRTRVWQCVSGNWHLTRTHPRSLAQQLEAIGVLECGGSTTGIARTLLAFAAIRNFGSHRFSRDPELLSDYGQQMIRAAVYTPLLYWKVAQSLG
jgi:hypothetical protein